MVIMDTNILFVEASRKKLRFDTRKGPLSVEDLWDLPLEGGTKNQVNLDEIALELHGKVRDTEPMSFVNRPNTAARSRATAFEDNQTRFAIVKIIIDVKLAEEEAAVKARENKEKRNKILSTIAKKQDGEMEAKSLDELKAMLGDLD